MKHCFLFGKNTVYAKRWPKNYYGKSAPACLFVTVTFCNGTRIHDKSVEEAHKRQEPKKTLQKLVKLCLETLKCN